MRISLDLPCGLYATISTPPEADTEDTKFEANLGNFERHKNKKYNKVLEIQLSEETLVWYECSLGLIHKRERETDMGRDTDSGVGCVLYINSI